MNDYDLARARKVLATQRPYFAIILYALKFNAKPGLGTLAVDKRANLYYDPTLQWTGPETASVLYHEIAHLLRDHSGRFTDLKRHYNKHQHYPKLWNIAADCEINQDLLREGISFPKGTNPPVPSTFNLPEGRTAEFYYEQLLSNTQASENVSCECGSAAHGQESEYEDTAAESQVIDIEDVRRKVAKDIINAGKAHVADSWLKWAKSYYINPSIWQAHLSRTLRRSLTYTTGYQDYTYSRPSRRETGEFILPSMRRPLPHIAVVLDISGSMEGEPSRVSLDALDSIFQHSGVSGLTLLCTNTRVAKKFANLRTLSGADIPFDGGTDMGAGIEYAKKLKPLPTTIIVLTDGETPWPDRKPEEFDVIIGLVTPDLDTLTRVERWSPIPEWARRVDIFYHRGYEG